MTPQFAQAIDPIFLQVLGLLDRLGRSESPSPQDERFGELFAGIDPSKWKLFVDPVELELP
jgi:hypothetical protein